MNKTSGTSSGYGSTFALKELKDGDPETNPRSAGFDSAAEPNAIGSTGRSKRSYFYIVVISAIAASGLMASRGDRLDVTLLTSLFTAPPRVSGPEVDPAPTHTREYRPPIMLTNSYERAANNRLGSGLYKYDYLVEIYRSTRLEIQEPDDDCYYSWQSQGKNDWLTGPVTDLTFTRLGANKLYLNLTCATGSMLVSYTVTAKYVRKEIRTLDKSDRSDFFDALETVYRVNHTEGMKMYGSKYRSIDYLVEEHLQGAADRECDHWHDDAGIMSHHMAFTLELEQSLQSIDKKCTIPYWDYTQDAYYDADDWTKSKVWHNSWFGPASPSNDHHAIDKGRFAYTHVNKETKGSHGVFSRIRNPYGYLRSPWNTNPTPFVMRNRYVLGSKDGQWTLPDCMLFQRASTNTELSGALQALNGYLHGPVHIMVGGHWSWNKEYDISEMSSNYSTLSSSFLLSSKYMWRQGYVRCPEVCSDDTPVTECECSCPADIIGRRSAHQVLTDAGIFNLTSQFEEKSFLDSVGLTYSTLLDLLCHVGHPGEMFTSAAPYDPIFWSLHGLAERFLTYKRMQADSFLALFSTDWGYQHDRTASDTEHRCDWDGVTGMEMPNCYSGTCPGHKADDLLPMGNFLDQNETYSNQDFFDFTSPQNSDLPYIYDNFDSWPACTEQNITWY